jgi:hypothetical protein
MDVQHLRVRIQGNTASGKYISESRTCKVLFGLCNTSVFYDSIDTQAGIVYSFDTKARRRDQLGVVTRKPFSFFGIIHISNDPDAFRSEDLH